MIALAAQESGLDKEFILDINANAPSTLYGLYLSTYVVQQAVAAQDQAIRKTADNGSCVTWAELLTMCCVTTRALSVSSYMLPKNIKSSEW